MLRDGDGGQRRHLAQHRAFVAGGDDRHGLGEIVAERILDEFAHFSTALAHQRDDDLVEGIRPRQHRQKRRLADA